jgi:ribose transport system substrate-binding protein
MLAILFGLLFAGATLLNWTLIGRSRAVLSAPGKAGTSSGLMHHLALIVPDTDDSFFLGLIQGAEEAAAKTSAAVQVFRYPAGIPDEADRLFDIVMRARLDGLIMYTAKNDPVEERRGRSRMAGIVFVPVGTDVPATMGGFIGSGSLLQGFEGGRLICRQLGGAARIGIILAPGSDEDADRDPLFRGVASAIKAYPGAAIVAALKSGPGVLSGEEEAASIFRSQPGINALFCSRSRNTVGAAQVVVDLNKVGDVFIVGSDETPEIRRFIDKGVIGASIVRDSNWIGAEAVRTYDRIHSGQAFASHIEASFSILSKDGRSRP